MDASTMVMTQPPPLPQLLPLPIFHTVNLSTPPLNSILAQCTKSPQSHSPGEIPTNISHSIGEKSDCHGRKCFEDHYGVKQNINGTHLFHKWFLRTNIGSQLTPR